MSMNVERWLTDCCSSKIVERCLEQVHVRRDAGAIDEDVETAEARAHLVEQRDDRRPRIRCRWAPPTARCTGAIDAARQRLGPSTGPCPRSRRSRRRRASTGATSGLEQAPLSETTATLPSIRNRSSSETVMSATSSTRRSTQLTWPAPKTTGFAGLDREIGNAGEPLLQEQLDLELGEQRARAAVRDRRRSCCAAARPWRRKSTSQAFGISPVVEAGHQRVDVDLSPCRK